MINEVSLCQIVECIPTFGKMSASLNISKSKPKEVLVNGYGLLLINHCNARRWRWSFSFSYYCQVLGSQRWSKPNPVRDPFSSLRSSSGALLVIEPSQPDCSDLEVRKLHHRPTKPSRGKTAFFLFPSFFVNVVMSPEAFLAFSLFVAISFYSLRSCDWGEGAISPLVYLLESWSLQICLKYIFCLVITPFVHSSL